jgi:hypothetical protein
MSRNGSGVYSKVNTFVSGNPVTAAGHNQNWDDLVTEMTNSVAADGQTSMTGPLKASSGTNSLPSHTFASDPDTGMYRSASNEASIAVGGTQIVAVNSSGLDVKSGTVLVAGVAAFPVPTAQIADDAVTFAKMQNSTGSALIGKNVAGSGNFKELTLGTGLEFSGTTLVASLNATSVPGFLSGLELVNVGTSGSIDISAGAANDVASGGMMTLAATLRKTTSSWTVGDAAGGLDTGAIATSTWYHFFLIKRTDTGVVDVLFSTSVSSPTMPTNYTLKRRIGSAKTNGSSQWTAFTQVGDTFIWAAAVGDATATTTTTSRTLLTVTVPPGVNVTAKGHVILSGGGGGSTHTMVGSPLENDAAVSASFCNMFAPTSSLVALDLAIMTNTSAQIAHRSGNALAVLAVYTFGWIDRRGK